MVKKLGIGFLFGMLSVLSYGQTHKANHLVISEVGVYAPSGSSNTPDQAEYTEIYNPTGNEIDLSNYYLSDFKDYWKLPGIIANQTVNLLNGSGDFNVKFPTGAKIPAGGVVVVTSSGNEFLKCYFNNDYAQFTGQPGNPQLFEIEKSNSAVPDMGTNYNEQSPDYPLPRVSNVTPGPGGNNMSHTDAGEHVVLYYWDPASPVVKDVDVVQYLPHGASWGGSDDKFQDKSGEAMVNAANVWGTYAVDHGSPANMDVKYPNTGPRGHLVRRSILEPEEFSTNGNGITGHDETMESNNLTWEMILGSPSNGSPGLVNLPLTSQNSAPVIGKGMRNIPNPAPGDIVQITVPVYDDGPVVVTLMVDKGTGYQPTAMTSIGGNIYTANIATAGLAQGKVVKYYVKAKDSGNLETTQADYQELRRSTPHVEPYRGYECFMVKSTPYQPGDILVTEVMYDPHGTNNGHNSQYIELYNPGNTPLEMTGFIITADAYPNVKLECPDGFTLPAKGYGVLVGNGVVFNRKYPNMDPKIIADYFVTPSEAFIPHAGTTVRFFDPNVTGHFSDTIDPNSAFKTFSYTNVAPWPIGSPQNTGAGNTGYPIELTELTLAAEGNPAKWAQGLVIEGTAGAANSVDPAARPGDVSVSSVTRSVESPTGSDTFSISASVTSTNPISTVRLMVNSGSGFVPTNMTDSGGNVYTGTIGPFANKTKLTYYIEAADSAGHKGFYPFVAPVASHTILVDNTPGIAGFVVNEVMYDPLGSDNSTNAEFIELYNPTDSPIDLSYHMFGTSTKLNDTYSRILPAGTVIQPKDYLVLAPRGQLVTELYTTRYDSFYQLKWGPIEPEKIIDLAWNDASVLGNSNPGSTIYFFHPNQINYNGAVDSVSYYSFQYFYTGAWPNLGTEAVNRRSIELKDPALDVTQGSSWAFTEAYVGTPAAKNSVFVPTAGVDEWTLY